MNKCDINILSIETSVIGIPQRVVFQTAQKTTAVSDAVIVSIRDSSGNVAYGDGSPAEYVTGETIETVREDVGMAATILQGRDVNHWRANCRVVREALRGSPTACAALEIALVDLFCKSNGMPMCRFFGNAEDSVVSDITIPIVDPQTAFELARKASETYTSLKVKVGGRDREEDLERVHQAHRGAPSATLRMDANQGFQPDEAIQFIKRLKKLGIDIELVEQPVHAKDIEGLKYVADRLDEPVIADESAVDPAAALKLVEARAVDGVNIKLMKSGILDSLDIISIAQAAGLKLMLGCMLESPVGIGAAVHLACGTGAFNWLDLDADVLGEPTGLEQNYTRDGERLFPCL